MKKGMKGFTLIELLVVIAIIALLMGILMPALQSVNKQAKSVVCLATLHQWSLIWKMYTDDNNGRFHAGLGGESQESANRWPKVVSPYYKDPEMRICPMAKKPMEEGGQNPFAAWGGSTWDDGIAASFGFNEFLCNRREGGGSEEGNSYFRTVMGAERPNNVPMFMDCAWYDVWVHDTDEPPPYDGATGGWAGSNEIRRVCLNRHSQGINVAFLDFTGRKVDLKELWTLKWSKVFNTANNWTKAGGAMPEDWPQWMRGMKDY